MPLLHRRRPPRPQLGHPKYRKPAPPTEQAVRQRPAGVDANLNRMFNRAPTRPAPTSEQRGSYVDVVRNAELGDVYIEWRPDAIVLYREATIPATPAIAALRHSADGLVLMVRAGLEQRVAEWARGVLVTLARRTGHFDEHAIQAAADAPLVLS